MNRLELAGELELIWSDYCDPGFIVSKGFERALGNFCSAARQDSIYSLSAPSGSEQGRCVCVFDEVDTSIRFAMRKRVSSRVAMAFQKLKLAYQSDLKKTYSQRL